MTVLLGAFSQNVIKLRSYIHTHTNNTIYNGEVSRRHVVTHIVVVITAFHKMFPVRSHGMSQVSNVTVAVSLNSAEEAWNRKLNLLESSLDKLFYHSGRFIFTTVRHLPDVMSFRTVCNLYRYTVYS